MLDINNITEEDRVFVKSTLEQFEKLKTPSEIFYELCFAICAPQTTFKSNLKVIDKLIDVGFAVKDIPKEVLEEIVKPARFYRNKSRYLLEAKKNFYDIYVLVRDDAFNGVEKRALLVRNVKGLGMKAASHFLRNLGYKHLAIIDTHVLKFLDVKAPKNKYEYYDIEDRLDYIACGLSMTIAELDALIWKYYSKTEWMDYVH